MRHHDPPPPPPPPPTPPPPTPPHPTPPHPPTPHPTPPPYTHTHKQTKTHDLPMYTAMYSFSQRTLFALVSCIMFMCIAQFCASQDVWRVVNDRQLEYLIPPWERILQTNKPYRTLLQYDDVIMGAMAPQITSLTNVYSTVYSGADQSQHQSAASLAFVCGIHWGPVNSSHKWPVTRKMFPFDDVIMAIRRQSLLV